MTTPSLLDVLGARRGLVCLTGAGGKKTTLYRLAALHPGRIGLSATVHIPPFPTSFPGLTIVADESILAENVTSAAGQNRLIAYACPTSKPNRLAGVADELIAYIHHTAGFDATFIKADGARQRLIKAPGEDEPRIPAATTTVIPVVSARAIGRPLSEAIAHRPERIAVLTGAMPGETLTPEHLARLLSAPEGALKGTGNAEVVPLINAVDDAERETLARQAAELALAATNRFQWIVLCCMKREQALVAVIGDFANR